jgi:acid phosphatase type 7
MRTRTVVATGIAFVLIVISCSEPAGDPSALTAPTALPSSPSFAKGGASNTVKSITVSPSSVARAAGETVQLTATAKPAGSATTFQWTSSSLSVAAVNGTGLVTAVGTGTATIRASAGGKTSQSTVTVTAPTPPPPPPGTPVLVGAGDIAECGSTGDDATAAVLDNIAGTVFTLGDNAYQIGSTTDFANCYNHSWGRHKNRTRPSPGNHEYGTSGAAGYFTYFGSAAGEAGKGYYTYTLGSWLIIVLNSNTNCGAISCAAGSTQEQWLRSVLAASQAQCTLAYWHHPRFNSGAQHGNSTAVAPFWSALYQYGADVVLNGHEHVYERFAPQTPAAVADPARGIRQFTVGTGGADHYSFGTIKPNSERRSGTATGVLKLTLREGAYYWEFVSAAGSTFTDSGTGVCH